MTIGFIGLGDMGMPMVRRLAAAGHDVIAWNRSREKAGQLAADGVRIANTPAEVAGEAELIGLCLLSHVIVEQIVFGPGGLFSHENPRVQAIGDFSTGAVEAAQDFARRAAERGIDWIDAPVSGGVPAATNGQLIVFAGGEQAAIDRLGPLFAPLSARVTRMGGSGAGQATKICNQAIVAANILVLAETMAMARRAGINVERLPGALAGGFADSSPLQIFGPRMAEHVFAPRLGAIAVMAKDTGLARGFAERFGASTPILRAVQAIYAGIAEGGAPEPDDDISALIRLYEKAAA